MNAETRRQDGLPFPELSSIMDAVSCIK